MIKHCKLTSEITIKPWAEPVIWLFVFFGMYPPKWVFLIKHKTVEA
jgi:hypothetical protein